MVVQGLIALALALPTGMLFGVGYGTGVRIGYEQVYPLLFPKANTSNNAEQVKTNLQSINRIYDTIGGKEASNMGIAMGLNSVRSATENNPDFHYLEELELKLSGRMQSSSGTPSSSSIQSLVPQESFDDISLTGSSIPLFKPSLTLTEKQFLVRAIENANMATLLVMRQRYNDENLQQLIRTRINKLAATQRIENVTGNVVPKSPVISTGSIKQSDSYVRAQYQNQVFSFQKVIKEERRKYGQTINNIKNIGFTKGLAESKKRGERNIAIAQQKLINFITVSRNNIKLKSLANNDWNKRIWKNL